MLRAPLALTALLLLFAGVSNAAESTLPVAAVPPVDQMHRVDRMAAAPGEPRTEAMVPTGWQIEGGGANVKYGWSATTVGDVNADGYSDVMVTSDGATSGTGAARLYLGGAGGLASSPVWSRTNFTLGPKAAPAGDVNGDGYGDFIVGWSDYFGTGASQTNVYYGSFSGVPTGPFVRNSGFGSDGYSFGTAGDVNGDGYDDIVLGAPNASCNGTQSGVMTIYYGGPTGIVQANSVVYCPPLGPGAHFGYSVGSAGDINADGYGDVIAGAPDYTITSGPGSPAAGYVAIYLGSPGGLGGTFQTPPIRMSALQIGCRYGATVSTAGDFNGDGFSDVMVSAPLFGSSGVFEHGDVIVYSGAASPGTTLGALWGGYDWQFYAHFGAALAPAGDVNGDGYSDIAIASPDVDGTFTDQGNVYVLFGRHDGQPTNLQTLSGGMASERFGSALGTAGDVDGDGFSDLVIGGYGWSNPEFQEGRAVLYRGGADMPQLTPQWSALGNQHYENAGWSVAAAGDVNGDGYGDAIVGAWLWDGALGYDVGKASIYLGGPTGLATSPSPVLEGNVPGAAFGFNVAAAGDVNGDGYGDVIVGQPYNGVDAAKVFLGGAAGVSTSPVWTGTGAAESGYGIVVAGAGDVNGDGYSDVLVGAPLDDAFGADAGRAYLYLGGPGGPSLSPNRTFHGSQAGEHLGEAVAGAGDVNGDGLSDIVIGAPLRDWQGVIPDAGRILVYLGTPVDVGATPVTELGATAANMRFGSRVAGLGDANGDGYSDVAISSPGFTNTLANQGLVLVYRGGPTGLGSQLWNLPGPEAEGQFGSSLGAAGDVNGDGKSDLIAGSYLLGSNDNGAAMVYTTTGSTTPFWTKSGTNPGDWFGFAAAGAGDVNGDGFADLLVGAAAMEANGGQDAGQAFVYLGNLTNGDDGVDRVLRIRRTDDAAPIGPRGMSDVSNAVRLATLGRSAAGPSRLTMEYRLEPTGGGAVSTGAFGPVATNTAANGASAALAGNAIGLLPGKAYETRVRVRSRSPYFPFSPWLTPVMDGREVMDFRTRGVTLDAPLADGDGLDFAPPWPNPSRGAVALEFALPEAGHAKVAIFDVAGREVASVADGAFAAGAHRLTWSGADAQGRTTPAGIYFVKVTTPAGERVRRVVRMP